MISEYVMILLAKKQGRYCMKKTRLAAVLLALAMAVSMAACTEENASSSKKGADSSSSAADSSAVQSSEASSSASQTTTTAPPETTTTDAIIEQTTAATRQTTQESPDTFTDAIKADVESCRSGSTVDLFKLIEKWDIHPGQTALGGPNGKFMMQLKRNAADTAYEGFIISADGETGHSFNIMFAGRTGDYPVYDCKYFEENVKLTGYVFVALYRVAKYNDYSLCGTEPYVDMSIHMDG